MSEKPKKKPRKKKKKKRIVVLSKKDKLDIIRDILMKNPRAKKYGFNIEVQRFFRNEFKVKVHKSYISKLIKEVFEEWKRGDRIIYGKERTIRMWERLFEKAENEGSIGDQIRILHEIGNIEGHYDTENAPKVFDADDMKKQWRKAFESARKERDN